MKSPDRKTVTKLEALPNIGKTIASYLRSIGIGSPQELVGKDPFKLYELLVIKKGIYVDPCVIDVFMAVIDYMEGGEAVPWWTFTPKRKQIILEKKDPL